MPKILVVEDDKNTSNLICEVLSDSGYQISTAFDGEQALNVAVQELPDLITLNVVMPRMDGFEACRRLKNDERTKNIPVIFLTGQKRVDQIILGYDLGADHYITKPFHFGLLLAQLRMSLRREGHKNTAGTLDNSRNPKVFISYKWEGDDHNDWVMKIAVDLRSAGIEASLDRWEVRLGDSFTEYMTSKISEADVILFIMTTASVAAIEASGGKGGAVKFEMQLATSRRIAGESLRIIPIYREGNNTAAHVRDHRYADFRDDLKYEQTIQMLVADLLGTGPSPPPIGKG
jgi:DNA-binding response OmpR family regulator